ncbi:MAG: hypothetical protein ACREJC_11595 [Tepidisphaeraceae bacterium]
MNELTNEEQGYLLAAFATSPNEWFLPRTLETRNYSPPKIDRIVQALAERGLLMAQPDCHARLTDRGRSKATLLAKLAGRDWRKFYKRRKIRIVAASIAGGVTVLLITLKLARLI